MKHFMSDTQIAMAFDIRASRNTAFHGDWVNMEGYESLTFILVGSVGTATTTNQNIHMRQARTNAGTDGKDIPGRIFYEKQGSDVTNVGQYTPHGPTTGFQATGAAENIVAVEVTGNELDVAGGFNYVACRVDGGAGTDKNLVGLYILRGARYQVKPEELPAVLA